MNTDDLIKSLGSELSPLQTGFLTHGVIAGLVGGLMVTGTTFALFWGVRSDPGAILGSFTLLMKTVLPLGFACLALPWMVAQARPAGRSIASCLIWVVPAALGILVLLTLIGTPDQAWAMDLRGKSITTCLVSIPVLSMPILAGLLVALRRGAPEHPALCGAVAGLTAGAAAAAVYSFYCIENSPLFYGTWYTLSVLGVAAFGAVVGRQLLRW